MVAPESATWHDVINMTSLGTVRSTLTSRVRWSVDPHVTHLESTDRWVPMCPVIHTKRKKARRRPGLWAQTPLAHLFLIIFSFPSPSVSILDPHVGLRNSMTGRPYALASPLHLRAGPAGQWSIWIGRGFAGAARVCVGVVRGGRQGKTAWVCLQGVR